MTTEESREVAEADAAILGDMDAAVVHALGMAGVRRLRANVNRLVEAVRKDERERYRRALGWLATASEWLEAEVRLQERWAEQEATHHRSRALGLRQGAAQLRDVLAEYAEAAPPEGGTEG